MEDIFGYLVGMTAIISAVVVFWLILSHVTRWKAQATLTREDENLLDELYDLARRLDERVCTVERIMTAENPNWRSLACDPVDTGITAQTSSVRSLSK